MSSNPIAKKKKKKKTRLLTSEDQTNPNTIKKQINNNINGKNYNCSIEMKEI